MRARKRLLTTSARLQEALVLACAGGDGRGCLSRNAMNERTFCELSPSSLKVSRVPAAVDPFEAVQWPNRPNGPVASERRKSILIKRFCLRGF
jgi:hypothetical protein